MLKRNDKCHCGSGKKYKKCCMDTDAIKLKNEREFEQLLAKKNMVDKKYSNAVLKLGESLEKLIDREEAFSKMEEEIRATFFDNMVIKNIAANRFFSSYFSYDCYINTNNITPASYVINTEKFSKQEKSVIENCINSYPSLFEISKIDKTVVVIKDVFTEKEYYTLDSKILDGFSIGDHILGRPVRIDDVYVLIDLTIRIQSDMVDMIKNTFIDAYNENKDKLTSMEYFVSINTLFFYKYMLQLLQISDYKDSELEDSLNEIEGEDDEESIENEIKSLIEDAVEDLAVLNKSLEILSEVSEKIKVNGYESGWAAGIVYYSSKSLGENVTQSSVAKLFGVSVSTLSKRSKEISGMVSES